MATPTPPQAAVSPWSPRSIAWRTVLASAPWLPTALVSALTLIPLAVLEFGRVRPRTRPHDVYDATISHPLRPNTIPAWVAGAVPLLLAILSAAAGEVGLRRGVNGSATAAAAGVLYSTLDAVAALFTTGLLTEATKLGVGWLRPYFLAACAPSVDPSTGVALHIGDGGGVQAPPCTASLAAQAPARVSFPSGHTSMSAVSAAFGAALLLWSAATGLGNSGRPASRSSPSSSSPSSFCSPSSPRARDVALTAALLAALAQLGFAWGIGATRLNDFRHHPADVVGGFVLGAGVGGLFAVRSIVGRRTKEDALVSCAEEHHTLLHCIRACTSPFKPCCVDENKAFWACYKAARGLGDSTSLSGVLGSRRRRRKEEDGEEKEGEG